MADYRELSEHMELFRCLFDSNQIGITITNRHGVILYYNQAQASLDGLESSWAIGRTICDVYNFSSEDSPTMRALRTGVPVFDSVHFYRTRLGRLVNSSCDIYPLLRNSEVVGALCCIQGYSIIDRRIGALLEGVGSLNSEDGKGGEPRKKMEKKKIRYRFSHLVGKSPLLAESVALAKQAAASGSPVMLVGETGVGKEIFAQAIHEASPRGKGPYTAINCSAMPETLLEGILFGSTRGAFTGAIDKAGLFEMTQHGTLFLDEIDSMPVSLQSKLLRVLQEKQVRRIGDSQERPLDVRVISSVSCNPLDRVKQGILRADFYYRLGVIKIAIAPLRERMEDLHLLAQHFIKKHSAHLGISPPLITPEGMGALYSHNWPGNVREFEHTIEATLNILGHQTSIQPEDLRRAHSDMFAHKGTEFGKSTPWLAYQTHLQKRVALPPEPLADVQQVSPIDGDSASAFHPPVPASAKFFSEGEGARGLQAKTRRMEEDTLRSALHRAAGSRALAARLLHVSPQLLQYKLKKFGISAEEYVPRQLEP